MEEQEEERAKGKYEETQGVATEGVATRGREEIRKWSKEKKPGCRANYREKRGGTRGAALRRGGNPVTARWHSFTWRTTTTTTRRTRTTSVHYAHVFPFSLFSLFSSFSRSPSLTRRLQKVANGSIANLFLLVSRERTNGEKVRKTR